MRINNKNITLNKMLSVPDNFFNTNAARLRRIYEKFNFLIIHEIC